MGSLRGQLSRIDGMAEVAGAPHEQMDASEIVRAYFTAYDVEKFPPPTALPTVIMNSVPRYTLSKFVLGPAQVVIDETQSHITSAYGSSVNPEDEFVIAFQVTDSVADGTLVSVGADWSVDVEGNWVVFRMQDSNGLRLRVLEPENSRKQSWGKKSLISGGTHSIKVMRVCSSLGPEPGQGEKRLLVYVNGRLAASAEDKTKEEKQIELLGVPEPTPQSLRASGKVASTVSGLTLSVRKGTWADELKNMDNTRSADEGEASFREEFEAAYKSVNGDWDAVIPDSGGQALSEKYARYTYNRETDAYESSFVQPNPDVVPTLNFPFAMTYGLEPQRPVSLAEMWPTTEATPQLDWNRRIVVEELPGKYSFLEAKYFDKGTILTVPKHVSEMILYPKRTYQDFDGRSQHIKIPFAFRIVPQSGEDLVLIDFPESAGASGRLFEVRGCAIGGGLNGGHWWAYAKIGKKWHGFDDSATFEVDSVQSIATQDQKCKDAVLLYVAEFKPAQPSTTTTATTTTTTSTATATINRDDRSDATSTTSTTTTTSTIAATTTTTTTTTATGTTIPTSTTTTTTIDPLQATTTTTSIRSGSSSHFVSVLLCFCLLLNIW